MLKQFTCCNFKNIIVKNIKFNKFNIFLSPNGYGKSNLLKSIMLVSDIGKKGLNSVVKRYGIDTFTNKSLTLDRTDIEYHFSNGYNYKLSLNLGKALKHLHVISEVLNIDGVGLYDLKYIDRDIDNTPHYKLLSKKWHLNRDVYINELFLNRINTLHSFDKVLEKHMIDDIYNNLHIFTQFKYINNNFINIKSVVGRMFEECFDFNKWLTQLKQFNPSINRLRSTGLYVDNEFYNINNLSDGLLRIMYLSYILCFYSDNLYLLLDNPEIGLHPAWQKVLGGLIQSSGLEQCFIATHSPDLLDTFTEQFKHNDVAIFVIDKYSVRKVTYKDIKDELGDWELGDLYRTADPALGGWQW